MAKIILRAGRVAIKIIIPFAILGLIFYSVKVLVPAQANVESFPEELAAQFEQAETYQEEGQYGEAEQIYQDIITQYPGTDGALAAQRQLTILYINWNKPAEADAALEELTSSFSEHPGIVRSVCEIADRYLDTNPAKALELYQYTMENWPSSEDAMWMQVNMTRAYLKLKNEAATETAYQNLLFQFSGHENLPEAVYTLAEHYLESGYPTKAVELYQYVSGRWPNAQDAVWMQVNMAKAYIKLKNEAATETVYQNLLSQFSGHENLPETVYIIAEYYMKSHCPTKAVELYEYAMTRWLDYDWVDENDAILHQKNLLQLKLTIGDDYGADTICDDIINNFADAEILPEVIREIKDAYVDAGQYDRVVGLCQYTLDRWSGTKHEIWAIVELVKSDIGLGQDPNNEGLDELITEFSNDARLTEATLKIAEGCYQKAFERENAGNADEARRYFENTIMACQRTIELLPESTTSPLAATSHHFIGEAYRRLGQLEEAIECYEWVVTNRPGSEYAADSQFLIGYSYEQLNIAGAISRSEANRKIRSAYEKVVQNYPNYLGIKVAQSWLRKHN